MTYNFEVIMYNVDRQIIKILFNVFGGKSYFNAIIIKAKKEYKYRQHY